ncbi:MAG TPA: outer membrane beta-barrel protein [Xanthobacteraceae bacterium]|nr:outer membrane beta-barrel protein [Xanthobacteraceae bacterium]
MVSVKSLLAAGAAAFISTAACAADMALPPPQLPVPVEVGGWYLRGDVGVGIQSFTAFDFAQQNTAFVWPSSWTIVQQDIQDATIAGFGIGYEVNNWLRLDVTGEYRTKAMFKATGSYTQNCAGGGTCFDVNSGNYSAAVFMANAYVDLGTWWCLTPYIGAGVGGAYNMISNVQDNGILSTGAVGFGYASGTAGNFDLAWNVQAGLTYNVTNTFKIDFNYRFLSLGSPQTGVVACQNTASCPGAFYTLRDMTSQDFRIGLRWMLMPAPAPVMPLMSRG